MNHYVNLLEPSECHYLSAAESSPIFKIIGGVVLLVIFGGMGLRYFGYQRTIAKGREIETWLEENLETSKDVKVRMDKADRAERAHQELEAWNATRYPYGRMLDFLASKVPEPTNQMQFSSLSLSETMLGMTALRQNPKQGESLYFPLERTVLLRVKGKVQSNRPDMVLDGFRNQIQSNPSEDWPMESLSLRLEQGNFRNPNEDSDEKLTAFSAEFILTPRRLQP